MTPRRSRSPRSAAGGTPAATRLPRRFPAAHHRRCGRVEQLPLPALESRAGRVAAKAGLTITVCHFPPGTSKWNKIEHRLFSHITMNWRGRPLTSHEVVLNTIAATTTTAGLKVEAVLDVGSYPTGIAVSRDQLAALPITTHTVHSRWNYTIAPTATTTAAPCADDRGQARARPWRCSPTRA